MIATMVKNPAKIDQECKATLVVPAALLQQVSNITSDNIPCVRIEAYFFQCDPSQHKSGPRQSEISLDVDGNTCHEYLVGVYHTTYP